MEIKSGNQSLMGIALGDNLLSSKANLKLEAYHISYQRPSGTLQLDSNGAKVLNIIAQTTSEGTLTVSKLQCNLKDGSVVDYVSDSKVKLNDVVSIYVKTAGDDKINNTVAVACIYE